MDLEPFVNYILIGAGVILIAVIVYKVAIAFLGRRGEEEAAPVTRAGESRTAAREYREPATAEGRTSVSQIFSRVAEEEGVRVQDLAQNLVDYSVARGGVSDLRPEVLRDMARQFGLFQSVVERMVESRGEFRGLWDDIFREAFRLIASSASK